MPAVRAPKRPRDNEGHEYNQKGLIDKLIGAERKLKNTKAELGFFNPQTNPYRLVEDQAQLDLVEKKLEEYANKLAEESRVAFFEKIANSRKGDIRTYAIHTR